MKTFFDGIYINNCDLQNEGEYPIKLEYYKTIKTEESVKAKYGIEIVVTEFINGKVYIKSKTIDNLASSLEEIEKILTVLKNNEVTPIGIEDAISEIAFI